MMDYDIGKQFEVVIANQGALDEKLALILQLLAEQQKEKPKAEGAAKLNAEGKVVE